VLNEIRAALGNTLLLAVSAACIGFTMGVVLGTTAAFFQGRWMDKVASAVAITGVSLPHYWVGIMLIIVFSVTLNWLPAMGMQEMLQGVILVLATFFVLLNLLVDILHSLIDPRIRRT
jgi:ABC-type dipeptide/oligopeptide/nickel transport system permease component